MIYDKAKIIFSVNFRGLCIASTSASNLEEKIIGAWIAHVPYGENATLTTQLRLEGSSVFSGVATVNGVVVWKFSGNWELENRKITYTYLESTLDLKGNNIDSDTITSITESEFSYKSVKSGKTGSYQRIEN